MIKSNTNFNPAALPAEYMRPYEKECAPATEGKNHFLYPGQVFVSRDGAKISTILGSCAAICLWDSRKRIGGMNHYLLAEGPMGGGPTPNRYGNIANMSLLNQMQGMGCEVKDLQGKIFGGASAFAADPDNSLGAQNVKLAEEFLEKMRIPLMLMDVSGKRGRRLIFNTADGTTTLRVFEKS